MVIASGFVVIDNSSRLNGFSISHEEGENERIITGALETGHSLQAREYTIFDVS